MPLSSTLSPTSSSCVLSPYNPSNPRAVLSLEQGLTILFTFMVCGVLSGATILYDGFCAHVEPYPLEDIDHQVGIPRPAIELHPLPPMPLAGEKKSKQKFEAEAAESRRRIRPRPPRQPRPPEPRPPHLPFQPVKTSVEKSKKSAAAGAWKHVLE